MITVDKITPSAFDSIACVSSVSFAGEERAFVNHENGLYVAYWVDYSDVKSSGQIGIYFELGDALAGATDHVKATCVALLAGLIGLRLSADLRGDKTAAIGSGGRTVASDYDLEGLFDKLVKYASDNGIEI